MDSNNIYIPYGSQSISEEDIEKVLHALRQPLITRGASVQAFEKAIAEYVGAPYAVAFSNGSAALWAAYGAAGLDRSDVVVTSPNTFVATASFAPRVGAQVDFIDIDLASGNMRLDLLKSRLERPKSEGRYVIAPVHFAGIPVDMEMLQESISTPNAVVIEDAAHALGSIYPSGEKVGCSLYSDMTIFSFHPVKNITTGEGGMVTTQDEKLYQKLIRLRNSGIERHQHSWYYEVHDIVCQAHMTEFQAALGLSQFGRLDQFIQKRTELVKQYRRQLTTIPGVVPFSPEFDSLSAYHLFVVQIDFERFGTDRTTLMERLKNCGIGTQLHYVPMYYHPIFHHDKAQDQLLCPNMERYFATALTLPLHVQMDTAEVDRVCKTLKSILFSI